MTDTFKIYVTTNIQQDYFVNQLEEGLSITNTEAGHMTGVQLLPDTEQLGVSTNYAVYFTIVNELPAESYVEITFPQDYFKNLNQVSCEPLKTAGVDTTCALVDGTTNIIRISDVNKYSSVEQNTEIAFLLMDV